MDKIIWFLLTLIFTGCASQRRRPGIRTCPPPTGTGICASTCGAGLPSCRPGLLCCRNGCGAYQCTRPLGPNRPPVRPPVRPPRTGVPPWCPPGSPRIQCFVNPCTVMRCPRFPWARCLPSNPCEPACSGTYYLQGRRLSDSQCNSGD